MKKFKKMFAMGNNTEVVLYSSILGVVFILVAILMVTGMTGSDLPILVTYSDTDSSESVPEKDYPEPGEVIFIDDPSGVIRIDSSSSIIEDESVETNDAKENEALVIDDPNFVYYSNVPLSRELQYHTYITCQTYGVRYTMMLALMFRESRCQIDIQNVNKDGTTDHGLCQINDSCIPFMQEFDLTDPDDPHQNIEMGVILMDFYLRKHDNQYWYANMCYQYGEGGAAKKIKEGKHTSTAIELLNKIEKDIIAGNAMNY